MAESLAGVLAQRLLRPLCLRCLRGHSDVEARRFGTEHGLPLVPVSAGTGCEHCGLTGYHGRLPVAELLTPSDALRDAISRGATAHGIRAAMRAAGIPTMRDQALRLVTLGLASIEEVGRFAVNIDAAQRHRLRLSSRLLSLARIVKGRNTSA